MHVMDMLCPDLSPAYLFIIHVHVSIKEICDSVYTLISELFYREIWLFPVLVNIGPETSLTVAHIILTSL